jgi:hypothetical protein
MESQHNIPLNEFQNGEVQESHDLTGHTEFSLPRADGGRDAWLFLTAGFMAEFMVWGQYPLHIQINILTNLKVSHSHLVFSKNTTAPMNHFHLTPQE